MRRRYIFDAPWQHNDASRVSIRINQINDCECKISPGVTVCFVRTTLNRSRWRLPQGNNEMIIGFYLAMRQAVKKCDSKITGDVKNARWRRKRRCSEEKRNKTRARGVRAGRDRGGPGVAFARQLVVSLAQASSSRRASPDARRVGSDITWRKLRAPGRPAMMPSMWRVIVLSLSPRCPCSAICACI